MEYDNNAWTSIMTLYVLKNISVDLYARGTTSSTIRRSILAWHLLFHASSVSCSERSGGPEQSAIER